MNLFLSFLPVCLSDALRWWVDGFFLVAAQRSIRRHGKAVHWGSTVPTKFCYCQKIPMPSIAGKRRRSDDWIAWICHCCWLPHVYLEREESFFLTRKCRMARCSSQPTGINPICFSLQCNSPARIVCSATCCRTGWWRARRVRGETTTDSNSTMSFTQPPSPWLRIRDYFHERNEVLL